MTMTMTMWVHLLLFWLQFDAVHAFNTTTTTTTSPSKSLRGLSESLYDVTGLLQGRIEKVGEITKEELWTAFKADTNGYMKYIAEAISDATSVDKSKISVPSEDILVGKRFVFDVFFRITDVADGAAANALVAKLGGQAGADIVQNIKGHETAILSGTNVDYFKQNGLVDFYNVQKERAALKGTDSRVTDSSNALTTTTPAETRWTRAPGEPRRTYTTGSVKTKYRFSALPQNTRASAIGPALKGDTLFVRGMKRAFSKALNLRGPAAVAVLRILAMFGRRSLSAEIDASGRSLSTTSTDVELDIEFSVEADTAADATSYVNQLGQASTLTAIGDELRTQTTSNPVTVLGGAAMKTGTTVTPGATAPQSQQYTQDEYAALLSGNGLGGGGGGGAAASDDDDDSSVVIIVVVVVLVVLLLGAAVAWYVMNAKKKDETAKIHPKSDEGAKEEEPAKDVKAEA